MSRGIIYSSQLRIRFSNKIYGFNPFTESINISNYIKENSSPSETIAVLGSEPQMYFYSQRHSATGFIYAYPLMEKQPFAFRMQQEMISEIESSRPRYLIWVNISVSWAIRLDSEKLILNWAGKYIHHYYKKVGIVDLWPDEKTRYYWGAEAQNVEPHSPYYVVVFERQN